jgi:hypothetical protein
VQKLEQIISTLQKQTELLISFMNGQFTTKKEEEEHTNKKRKYDDIINNSNDQNKPSPKRQRIL